MRIFPTSIRSLIFFFRTALYRLFHIINLYLKPDIWKVRYASFSSKICMLSLLDKWIWVTWNEDGCKPRSPFHEHAWSTVEIHVTVNVLLDSVELTKNHESTVRNNMWRYKCGRWTPRKSPKLCNQISALQLFRSMDLSNTGQQVIVKIR